MSNEEPTIVNLISLGCPKNLVDSEKMLGLLAEAGCIVGADADQANVIIVNTCGFLASARDESTEVIAEALAMKEAGSVRRVVVVGCMAQRDGDELRRALPGVDAVVGVNNRADLVEAVTATTEVTAVDAYRRSADSPAVGDDTSRLRLTPAHTAYLRISEGCGQGCSFCTIPAIRGPFRSKPIDRIMAEAAELIADGAVELNLIGQDTTSYGGDIGYDAGLAGLLAELNGLDRVRWIRLMYAYPSLVTDEIIDAIAECEKVVKYIDVPLQHVADGVLKRMRRRTSEAETERLIERLRSRVEDMTIRTTFIVGFPGETDAEYRRLLAFVEAARFDAMGVFAFSPEPGTAAAKMDGAVDPEVAAKRVEELMLAQQEIALAANAARIGKSIEVMVDGVDSNGYCVGRHAGQAPDVDSVCYLTDPAPAGAFVRATVAEYSEYDLIVTPSKAASRRKRRRR